MVWALCCAACTPSLNILFLVVFFLIRCFACDLHIQVFLTRSCNAERDFKLTVKCLITSLKARVADFFYVFFALEGWHMFSCVLSFLSLLTCYEKQFVFAALFLWADVIVFVHQSDPQLGSVLRHIMQSYGEVFHNFVRVLNDMKMTYNGRIETMRMEIQRSGLTKC